MFGKRDDARQARILAVILVLLFAAFAAFSAWRQHPGRAALFGSVAAAVALVALLARPLWMRFFAAWMKMAEGMSWVMTRVILGLFFFLVVTPVGLVMRLLGKGPLDVAWRDGKPSYWVDKPELDSTLGRFEKRY
jgi:hypothetical protein